MKCPHCGKEVLLRSRTRLVKPKETSPKVETREKPAKGKPSRKIKKSAKVIKVKEK